MYFQKLKQIGRLPDIEKEMDKTI